MCIVLDQRVDNKLIDMHGTNRNNKIRLYKTLSQYYALEA